MHILLSKIKKPTRWFSLLLAILFAAAITYCLFPLAQSAADRISSHIASTRILTLKVVSAGAGGGSEVWLTVPAKDESVHDLRKVPVNSDVRGECEYRRAEEYGYAFDFLVSFGSNLESVLKIPYTPSANAQLWIYCHGPGGIIELIDGDCDPVIVDTYSPTGEIKPFDLKRPTFEYVILTLISAITWGICTIGLYCTFISGFWKKGHSTKQNAIETSPRDVSIDLTRTMAAFGVVYVHSFLATAPGTTSYYATELTGLPMFGMTMLRHLALCCVPLFMLLSGYLCIHRTSAKKAWSSLIPMLGSFVLASCIHIVIRRFIWDTPISLLYVLNTFVGMDLAWYLEMYIGLVLLQPFLNTLWANLNRKKRDLLVLTLLALTALGSVSENILPTYWACLYPLTYYFWGAWLREYAPPCRRGPLCLGLWAMLCLEAVRSFGDAKGGVFSWQSFGGYAYAYNAMPVVICTITLFLITREMSVRSTLLKHFFQNAGKHTLSTYLVSVCGIDTIFYGVLLPYFPTAQEFFPIQLPAAAVLYLVVLLIANVVDGVTHMICGNVQKFLRG